MAQAFCNTAQCGSAKPCGIQVQLIRGVPYKRGCWDRRLGLVRENESFTQTERSLHHIFRRFGIYLADDLSLFVERIHLRLQKLGLNSDDVLKILGLAKFVHERKSGSNV